MVRYGIASFGEGSSNIGHGQTLGNSPIAFRTKVGKEFRLELIGRIDSLFSSLLGPIVAHAKAFLLIFHIRTLEQACLIEELTLADPFFAFAAEAALLEVLACAPAIVRFCVGL